MARLHVFSVELLELSTLPVSFKKIRLKNELKAWEAASPQDRIRFDEQLPT
jgi:hypothetical protein